jgi:hypothetical protein
MAQANRITPKLPPQAFKTYQIVAPVSSHWRPATCAEVECPHHLHGWSTTVDLSTDLGRRQASYITRESKRRYQADKAGGTLVRYTFEAGQRWNAKSCTSSEMAIGGSGPEHAVNSRGATQPTTGWTILPGTKTGWHTCAGTDEYTVPHGRMRHRGAGGRGRSWVADRR